MMRKIILLIIFGLSIMACNKKESKPDSESVGPNIVEPAQEFVRLDVVTSNMDSSKISVSWESESKICDQSDNECNFEVPKGASLSLKIIPDSGKFLLDTWGNSQCTHRSLVCEIDALENISLSVEGRNIEFLAHDSLMFNKFLRTVDAEFESLPAVISIPDRLVLKSGQAFGKKVVFEFENGECVYDGKIDICGIAHCDPTKVLALRSCEINGQQYTDVLNESQFFHVPDSVRIIGLNVLGKIRSDEKIELSFEFPVHAWKYDESNLNKINLN